MAASVHTAGYETQAFDRGTHPILQMLSHEQARQLVAYKGDEALRNRIDELAAKSSEGVLSAAEQAEYEGYVRANKFVATLQAQARKLITSDRQE